MSHLLWGLGEFPALSYKSLKIPPTEREPECRPPKRQEGAKAPTSTPKAMIFSTHSMENIDVNTMFRHFNISSYSYGAS